MLAACGGGGGGDDAAQAPTDAGGTSAPADPALQALLGTFNVGCKTYVSGSDQAGAVNGSISILRLVGADSADVEVRLQRFDPARGDPSAAPCDAATLVSDLTVIGRIRDLHKTKTLKADDGTRKTGKLVEFTYLGFRLSRGSLDFSIPAPNVTTTMGYVLEGQQLSLTHGPRDADGVSSTLAAMVGVRP